MRHQLDLHAAPALREHVQCRHAGIGVDHDQLLFRPPDELDQERLRVPELVLVEDALQRRLLGLHEEIDLLLQINDCLIMLGETTIHLVFQLVHASIDGISPQQILLQDCICPTTEQYALRRFHTIADGQNNIQTVIFNLIDFPICGSCRKFCDN